MFELDDCINGCLPETGIIEAGGMFEAVAIDIDEAFDRNSVLLFIIYELANLYIFISIV
jgi:hypothetical protein